MIVAMEKRASSMVDEWEKKVKNSGGHAELEVGDYMTHVTADIIAFTAFGSNYEKGQKFATSFNKLHSSILWVKEIDNDLVQYQDTCSFIHSSLIP
jgi:hypothetical protein